VRRAASDGGTISRPESGLVSLTPLLSSSISQAARFSTAGIASQVLLARQVVDAVGAGIGYNPVRLMAHGALVEVLFELRGPLPRVLGDDRHAQDALRAGRC
jgi:hypothetical protein